jgi:hypothetical protein
MVKRITGQQATKEQKTDPELNYEAHKDTKGVLSNE